jgi:8-oxo-dGTP diphosphatase
MRSRRTARILLLDPADRVLLIRCVVAHADSEFVFWLTPGGEIETGETPIDAARRELLEELGLDLELVGPLYSEATQFEHQGEMRDNMDFVFTARCAPEAPVLRGVTPDEIKMMHEIRWWTAAEIEASTQRIFPVDLATRLREAAAA